MGVSVAHDVDGSTGMSVVEIKTAADRLTKINFQSPVVEILAQVFEVSRQGRFQRQRNNEAERLRSPMTQDFQHNE